MYSLPDAISINAIEVDENHMQIRPEFFALLYEDFYRVDVVSAWWTRNYISLAQLYIGKSIRKWKQIYSANIRTVCGVLAVFFVR